MMLHVKKLHPDAKLPTVAHPGEDLAYDLYALESVTLVTGKPTTVRTGIAAQAFRTVYGVKGERLGLLIRDRSSMASVGVMVTGGVIDPGYTGEIKVILTETQLIHEGSDHFPPYDGPIHRSRTPIKAGAKIAQMVPIPALTGDVIEVGELEASARGDKGFGSSGK